MFVIPFKMLGRVKLGLHYSTSYYCARTATKLTIKTIIIHFYLILIIYFNNKMTACFNCRTMIEILKKEVEELSTREQQLIRVNNALTDVLRKTESTDHLEDSSWKIKYEQ